MGVTAIKSVANRTSVTYRVQNRENPNDTGGPGNAISVDPGTNRQVNMWIPWCDNNADFSSGKNILFEAVGTLQQGLGSAHASITVWQSGDYVYQSFNDTFSSSQLVAGNSTVNGDRSSEITDSGIRLY